MSDQVEFDERELTLQDYVKVLRRRWKTIALVFGLVLAAAIAYTALQTPLYQAEAEVLVGTNDAAQAIDDNLSTNAQLRERELENEVKFAESDAVEQRAYAEYGEDFGVTVTPQDSSDTLTISATADDPDAAAEQANVYALSYVAERSAAAANSFVEASTVLTDRLAELDDERQALLQSGRLQSDPRVVALNAEEASLLAKLRDLQISGDLGGRGVATITKAAEPRNSPVSPSWTRNLVLAAVVGLILGVAVALVRESGDDRLYRVEDVDDALPEAPVLAAVPAITARETASPVRTSYQSYEFNESMRSLRASLQYIGERQPLHSVAITSPNAAEGKTTVAMGLAVALARAGTSVVLVDADLRRPSVATRLRIQPAEGLGEFLAGSTLVPIVDLALPDGHQLSVIPASATRTDQTELLSSELWPQLIDELTQKFDMVIVDTAPLLVAADGGLSSAACDGVVLVCSIGATEGTAARSASTTIAQSGSQLIGTIATSVRTLKGTYY